MTSVSGILIKWRLSSLDLHQNAVESIRALSPAAAFTSNHFQPLDSGFEISKKPNVRIWRFMNPPL